MPTKANQVKSTYSIKSKLKGQTTVMQKVAKAPQSMCHQDCTQIRCNSNPWPQSQPSVSHSKMTQVSISSTYPHNISSKLAQIDRSSKSPNNRAILSTICHLIILLLSKQLQSAARERTLNDTSVSIKRNRYQMTCSMCRCKSTKL